MIIASRQLYFFAISVVALVMQIQSSEADVVTIANASFESPVLSDGIFVSSPSLASQGGHGWTTGEGLYNPPSNTYLNAGGNGTPTGADGSQVGFVNGPVGGLVQSLVGLDGIGGNSDDPLLTPQTTYTLTASVGRRLIGNQYGLDVFGGYELRMLAGMTVIGTATDAALQTEGVFLDRMLVVDSSTLDQALIGQPLSIQLRIAQTPNGGVTDFDNVRLDADFAPVPEPSTFGLMTLGLAEWCLGTRRRRAESKKYETHAHAKLMNLRLLKRSQTQSRHHRHVR